MYLPPHSWIMYGNTYTSSPAFMVCCSPLTVCGPTVWRCRLKLAVGQCRDLYAFCGDKQAVALYREGAWILNLASKKYSCAVIPHLPFSVPLITCVFGTLDILP